MMNLGVLEIDTMAERMNLYNRGNSFQIIWFNDSSCKSFSLPGQNSTTMLISFCENFERKFLGKIKEGCQ